MVVQDLPEVPNIECYCFNPILGLVIRTFGKLKRKLFNLELNTVSSGDKQVVSFIGKIRCCELLNSSRVIESLYLDLMAKECDKLKKWAIGPFNPMEPQEKNKDLDKIHESLK